MNRHYIQVWKEKVFSLEGQIEYCNKALASNLEAWERQEYQSVVKSKEIELAEARAQLQRVKAMMAQAQV